MRAARAVHVDVAREEAAWCHGQTDFTALRRSSHEPFSTLLREIFLEGCWGGCRVECEGSYAYVSSSCAFVLRIDGVVRLFVRARSAAALGCDKP
jgi:hypothetical protein